MRHLKLIAAALALLALSACVGIIVPIPLSGSASTHDTDHSERRSTSGAHAERRTQFAA